MDSLVKALYMAATVLIAVLILTGMVYIFREGAELNMNYDNSTAAKNLAKFNARIEALITRNHNNSFIILGRDRNSYDTKEFSCADEVVSVINLAYDYNKQNECDQFNQIEVYIYDGATVKYSMKVFNQYDNMKNLISSGEILEGNPAYGSTNINKITFADFLKEYGTSMIEPDAKVKLEGKMSSDNLDAIRTQNNYIYQYLFEATVEYDEEFSGKINKIEFRKVENELYKKLDEL